MSKLYAIYCAVVVFGMSAANYSGYTVPSMFNGKQTANRSVNVYHK